ncbi:UDP-glucose,sterol transferase [Dendryphion nanum]|uniref:UDP-glucose,sterol transferase n=1 Tax=Dendryphion nanum TaxID=256645 RepID=A0A9P9EDM0_9PLEO|nr:UDP-glucose,sterol transferase [Dendryphion nanum]
MANYMPEPEDVNDIPTTIRLQEPRFPSGNGSANTSTKNTDTQPSSPDKTDAPPANDVAAAKNDTKPQTTSTTQPRPMRRTQTEAAPGQRPMLEKSATERPQPKSRASLLGKKRAGTGGRPNNLGRQATLSFDPYSSDSSSSSDEDEPADPSNRDASHDDRSKERQQKSHKTHGGPFSKFNLKHEDFSSKGRVSKSDGRLKLSINETLNSGYFAKTLGVGLVKHLKGDDDNSTSSGEEIDKVTKGRVDPEEDIMEDPKRRVRLNIVVIVIGSRGDIQPFLKIGKILKEDYGHRVRIATHPAFKKFVEEDSKLEFFSVGGDPSELMAFMVKNPGLIPSLDTIKEGEIGKRRAAMYDMFQGMWRACINSTDDEGDEANLKMMGGKHPFIADAIIANPPSFAPPHIAEKLGIPLHMMFTFPYTPTAKFPHPLANIKTSNVEMQYTNFMSYPLVEMMTWQGLGDLINRFRVKSLCLEEVSTLWAPGQLYRLKVPYTYMWSPGLVPKPKDWGPEINLSGFVFLDLASSFEPPDDLTKFLEAGEPPIYIGFGSIVVDDPDKFTEMIFKAVEMAGVRALVSKGWGGFGSDSTPDNIFMLENTPHDWLFPKVSAVVHHGGAGTTAIGLKCGIPTMIVPFFGDQPFWGDMVSKAKAGAHQCIPYKKLTAERLAEGIKECLTDEAKENVQKIADSIAKEGDGAINAVQSFHRSLPLYGKHNMRCQMLENRVANWTLKGTDLRLSALAAELLVEWKKIKWSELRLARHFEWNDFGGPGEPITGIWGVLVGTVEDVFTGVGLVPLNMARSVKKREKYYEKKWQLKKRQKHNQPRISPGNKKIKAKKDDTNGEETNGRPKVERQQSSLSKLSEPDEALAEEFAHEAGHGFKKTGAAILKSPMYFSLAVTKGFHNAPRLYGDETVRRPPRVTGFHSGIRAGRDEFVHGIHDGVTGIWRQPIKGAKEGGVLGCMRGVGMGIGGFFLKDIAAFLGPGAYTMKGLDEESRKKYQPTSFIRRARIIQGQKDIAEIGPRLSRQKGGNAKATTEDEGTKRQDIELELSRRWEAVQSQISADKKKHRTGIRASLLGRSQDKGGTHIERKASRANIEPPGQIGNPIKASSTPIAQIDGASGDPEPAVNRGNTAPVTSTTSAKKTFSRNQKYTVEEIPSAVKEKAKKESNSTHRVPNVFEASLEGNGRPVGDGKPIEDGRPTSGRQYASYKNEQEEERPRTRSDLTGLETVRKDAEGDRSQSQ